MTDLEADIINICTNKHGKVYIEYNKDIRVVFEDKEDVNDFLDVITRYYPSIKYAVITETIFEFKTNGN